MTDRRPPPGPRPNLSADPSDHEPPTPRNAPRADPEFAHYWLDRIKAQLRHQPPPADGPPPPPGQMHLDDAP